MSLRSTSGPPVKQAVADETLSRLIGDVYDAALDPALWGEVLGKVRQFVGGFAAALFSKDATQNRGDVYFDDGEIDPHFRDLYFARYIELDPTTSGQYFAEIGEPISTADLLPYEEFVETRFYKEWARPQGCVDFVGAVLDKTATSVAMFGVFRHERDGLADDGTRHRMRLIVPHIRRAALIGRVIDLKSAETTAFVDVLNGLSAATFLVDRTGQIVHANTSGHALIAQGTALRAAEGKLVATDPKTALALSTMFAEAGADDISVGVKGIAVPLVDSDGDRYVAHMLPLSSGARRDLAVNYRASAALFVHKAAMEVISPPETIAKHFGLTPSELRVLLSIVQIGGVPETAQALGIAEQTVKTHLHRLFSKTGTTRQAELVKLVAGFSNPLIG